MPEELNSADLQKFLEDAEDNTKAFPHKESVTFDCLVEIDALFNTAEQIHPHRGDDGLLMGFLGRSRGGFLGGVRLAMGGQTAELYPLARSCLEYGLYAFYINADWSRGEIWANRSDSEADTKACKKLFRVSSMLAELETKGGNIGRWARELYERTISYGAHPNIYGFTTTVQFEKDGGSVNILHPGDLPWKLAVQTVAEVALCTIAIFELLFPKQFEAKGIPQRRRQRGWNIEDNYESQAGP